MVIKSIILLSFAFLLLAIPVVSAAETNVVVRTFTFNEVILTVAENTDDFNLITKLKGESDRNGEATFTFPTDKSEVKLYVQVRRNHENVAMKTFKDVSTAGKIELEVYPAGFEAPEKTNTTQTAEEQPANQTGENSTAVNQSANTTSTNITNVSQAAIPSSEPTNGVITGNAISPSSKGVPAFTYYIIIGVVVLVAIFFLFRKTNLFKRDPAFDYTRINPKGTREVMPRSNLNAQGLDNEILAAEKKIQEAQADISKIKKEEKILLAKKKLDDDQKELRRLMRK